MTQYYTFKVVTQSFLENLSTSHFFTEYILIGDFSAFIKDDELVINDDVFEMLQNKVEDVYENADGDTVSVQLLKIVNVEEVVNPVTSDGLNILMQQFYYFEEPISTEAFLEKYQFDQ